MRGGQARNGNPKGRAGDVVHTDAVTKRNTPGLTPVLTTDAYLEIGPSTSSVLHRQRDELAHTTPVEDLKGVVSKQSPFDVLRKEAAGIVAT